MAATTLPRTDFAATARFFRVLGDPTRLRILELLRDGESPVGRLVDAIGIPQARISTHLACLRHCGFVVAERRGKEVFYRLAISDLGEVIGQAGGVMEPLASRLASCSRIGPDWI